MARTNADIARAAGGKNDAFLARPFRNQRAESQGRLLDVAAERHATAKCARQLRHLDEKNVTRSRDDDLSRSSKKPEGTPKRELGARVNGTFHDRDRQLHRAGHPRVSASVYWLSRQLEDAAISVCAFPARRELENVHGPKRAAGWRRHHRHVNEEADLRAVHRAKNLALFRRGRSVARDSRRGGESPARARLRNSARLARNS